MIRKPDLRKNGLLLLTLLMLAVSALLVPQFANLRNINVIGIGRVPVAMFAMASLIPLAAGEFDISLGYMLGFLMMLGGKMASVGGDRTGSVCSYYGGQRAPGGIKWLNYCCV